MTSLRRRLLLWLLPATFFAGVLASVGTYWGAVFELGDLLNDQMRYIAEHVRIESSGRASIIDTSKPLDPEKADEILLQVWDKQGLLRYSSDPQLSLPAPQGTGLINIQMGGQTWHTFVSRRDDTLIQVAQAKDARWEALADLSIHLLWPVLSLVPLLAVFLWFGISYGLRPLRKIAAELTQRNPLSLEPIQTNDLPDEVSPLVGEVNSLLRRLEHSFALQKDFIADAAHELRTPVMALSIQAQLMQRASDESERQGALSQLLQAVERLNHLTQQLLTLARLEPQAGIPPMQPVELTALCKSVVMQHVRLAEAKQIDLGLDQSDLGIVSGDPETLRILLNNLVVVGAD
jgi:two-component system, OmpR family, sensor kinase